MSGRVTIAIPATPPSLNTWLSRHWRVRDRDKKRWQDELNMECRRWNLPYSERIEASVVFRFRDRRKRDTGNYSSVLEKCLGDALRPDFIADDDAQRFWMKRAEISPETGSPLTTIILDYELGELAA